MNTRCKDFSRKPQGSLLSRAEGSVLRLVREKLFSETLPGPELGSVRELCQNLYILSFGTHEETSSLILWGVLAGLFKHVCFFTYISVLGGIQGMWHPETSHLLHTLTGWDCVSDSQFYGQTGKSSFLGFSSPKQEIGLTRCFFSWAHVSFIKKVYISCLYNVYSEHSSYRKSSWSVCLVFCRKDLMKQLVKCAQKYSMFSIKLTFCSQSLTPWSQPAQCSPPLLSLSAITHPSHLPGFQGHW